MNRRTSKSTLGLESLPFYASHTEISIKLLVILIKRSTFDILVFSLNLGQAGLILHTPLRQCPDLTPRTSRRPRFPAYHRKPPCGRERPRGRPRSWNQRSGKAMLYCLYGCWTKNRGILPPKWMVYFMENRVKMDDLGVPLLLETPIFTWNWCVCVSFLLGWHNPSKESKQGSSGF